MGPTVELEIGDPPQFITKDTAGMKSRCLRKGTATKTASINNTIEAW